ncbi:response regulator transcription factor [Salinibacterium sp. ZJ454]|uniref:response regulator transcription factor n=1 Tax=Salinibacterium sp. ZJ454 TaxID=2708339 RepID=UPI00142113A0|nr:response regulator transcription factor [Salinibacterium sp. ZJ454]
MTALRLLLVDDESLVRTGLRVILESEAGLTVVGEASDGDEVERLVEGTDPDVVLMDVRMPRMNGLTATSRVIAQANAAGRRAPRILILTTFDSDDYVYEALRLGADGFVLKRAEPEELVRAIHTVAHSDVLLYPAAVRRLAALRPRDAAADGLQEAGLSHTEQGVLRLLARGLSNAEIAADRFVSVETVKTQVAGILTKLGVRDRTQAVIEAYESGFIVPG